MTTAVERTARLDPEQVIAAAEDLVVRQGWEALTMAALAAELGVRAPSLYRHVESLDALRRTLRLRTTVEIAEAVRTAVMGKSGPEGLHALAVGYRDYAKANPVRYLSQLNLAGDDEIRAAGRRLGEAAYAVLASFGLSDEQLPVATAQLTAIIHGFVGLELAQTIDWVTDPDAAFHGLVEIFAAGLNNAPAGATRTTRTKNSKGKRS
jgi:AcrR family transcriptional regulator